MTQAELFTGCGETLKEEGMTQVLDHADETVPEWKDRVLECIDCMTGVITSEDVRRHAEALGIPEPHHPSAWGAVVNAAAKKGLIVATGGYAKSKLPRSHGAILKLWRVM